MTTTRRQELEAIAAQCWCDPRTSSIEMDVRLAEVIVEKLAEVEREVWTEVMERLDRMFYVKDTRLDYVRDYRIDEFYAWCRQQAEEPHEVL